MDTPITSLQRPREFFSSRANLFRNFQCFKWQLVCRRQNGLLSYGAVRETALGLMIDAVAFDRWLLSENQRLRRGGEAA